MSPLTQQLQAAYANQLTTADFDLAGALRNLLDGVGMTMEDTGDSVTWTGADPIVKSPLRIGAAAGIGLLAKSVAAAAMHRWRGGEVHQYLDPETFTAEPPPGRLSWRHRSGSDVAYTGLLFTCTPDEGIKQAGMVMNLCRECPIALPIGFQDDFFTVEQRRT